MATGLRVRRFLCWVTRRSRGHELTLSLLVHLSDLLELSGTAADLKALSTALHARGMALMVDIIVNDVAFPLAKSTSTFDPTIGIYGPFDSWDDYHSACAISTSSQTSIENCALLCPPGSRVEKISEFLTFTCVECLSIPSQVGSRTLRPWNSPTSIRGPTLSGRRSRTTSSPSYQPTASMVCVSTPPDTSRSPSTPLTLRRRTLSAWERS